MGTRFSLPRRITEGNNLQDEAELELYEGQGAYVYVWRADNDERIEMIEEGDGTPEYVPRLLKHVRSNRRRYVEQRIADALTDDWQRGRLGLSAT